MTWLVVTPRLTSSIENLFCAGTYKNILERIAKPAREGALIKYDTIVTNIQSSGDDGGPLKVLTQNGQSFEFDEVVVTAPLGWLKQHPQAVSPPLPTRLTSAIKNIGYGCLEKVKAFLSYLLAIFQDHWLNITSRSTSASPKPSGSNRRPRTRKSGASANGWRRTTPRRRTRTSGTRRWSN